MSTGGIDEEVALVVLEATPRDEPLRAVFDPQHPHRVAVLGGRRWGEPVPGPEISCDAPPVAPVAPVVDLADWQRRVIAAMFTMEPPPGGWREWVDGDRTPDEISSMLAAIHERMGETEGT
jgi:hypothetical protein